ncbi:MAG: hypothetical protein ACD_56C00090G0003 [uncultured bacterium]|nr:MAG: hypothetical protein ACD_56C00090G0003 [uncultured bacterium]
MHKRNELVVAHMQWAKHLVNRNLRKYSSNALTNDDFKDVCLSIAYLALVKSAGRFDPSLEVSFKTFAEHRINGAIADELRSLDTLSRSSRGKRDLIDEKIKMLSHKLGRSPYTKEIAEALGIDLEEYHRVAAETFRLPELRLDEPLSLDDNDSISFIDTIPDKKLIDPHEILYCKELSTALSELFAQLSCKEEMALTMYFIEDMTELEIASVLGLTESRICQLINSALKYLRGGLEKKGFNKNHVKEVCYA